MERGEDAPYDCRRCRRGGRLRIPQSSPRVAIDGPDGAGKTHFADQLAVVLLNRHHRPVVRISIDGFHNLRAVRYRQGRDSPLGFWADSYNYDRFRRDVLEPFAPGGSRRFRRASYSHATDEILHPEPEIADPASVLVVDGIFLQRVELSAQWDLTVFLDVAFTETAKRMALRDGTPPDPDIRACVDTSMDNVSTSVNAILASGRTS